MAEEYWVYIGSVLVIAASAVFFLRSSTSEADKAFEARYRAMQEEKRKAALVNANNGTAATNADQAIVKKKEAPGGRVVVLFGSQTGTAQSFARTLADTGNEQGYFEVEAIDMEDFDRMTLKDLPYVIFVAATYGEGDPTDNAVDFMKFLRNDDGLIAKGDLANVKFTVFGLGNKQYEQYNAIGRAIDSLMAKHGAQRVYPHGEGDDDSELEEDFDAWRADLWKTLRKSHNDAAGSDDEQETKAKTMPPHIAFECKVVANATARAFKDDEIQNSNKHFFHNVEVKLVETRELRQSTEAGSTLHLEFDIKNTSLNYVTADNLAILPENDPSLVNRVANALSFKLQECVELSPVDTSKAAKHPFPTPATVEQILSSYVDLNGAPRKGALAHLAHFATNPVEQEKLLHLASPEGKDEYNKWVHDECRTYADVIEAFPSLDISFTNFIHIIPSLQPRYYTISSSSKVHPNRIHVTLGVIESKMKDGRLFRGVCSNFLSNMELPNSSQEKVKRPNPYGEQGRKQVRQWPSSRVTIRKSTFKLPSDPSMPVIMVGPGTGIAPMRAFLQERESQRLAGQNVGPTVLFFGCRRSTEDYLYADELAAYKANGTLTHLHCAFSRESAQKVYVQHLIAKEGAYLWDLLRQGAHVYVCGATVMGTDVHKAFENVVKEHGAKSAEQAADFVHEMQHNQRYIQELCFTPPFCAWMASPRVKSHALRSPTTPTKELEDANLQQLLRPILHTKHKIPQRPPRCTKPTEVVVLPDIHEHKPSSRGEDDDRNIVSNQLRPRSNGPEAGDVNNTVEIDPQRPLLASDLFFELQKQDEQRMSPRVAKHHNPNIYHDKMQSKYSEMRALRIRVKQLQQEVDTMKDANKVSNGEKEPTFEVKVSPEKTTVDNPQIRERMIKLEKHLLEAKEEIQTMRTKLDSGRTNDKALIDTLLAKLELERASNKVLGHKIFELEAALRLSVQRFTAVELELESERTEKEQIIEQLTTMSRQTISDHRRKIITSKVKGLVSSIGKESLQAKYDATINRLNHTETMLKQLELEAMTWKRESLQKQALLDDLERKSLTNSFVLSTRSQATHQLHPAIPALLELSNQIDQPEVVYQGSRVLDGHTLFFHLLRGQDTTRDNYTIHFIAYEPSTAQEDILTFYASDITRLVAEGEKYLLQPKNELLTQELLSILFTTLAVGFKNGSFYLVEKGRAEAERSEPKTKTTPLFHGSMLLQYQDTREAIPVALCINEMHASALCEVWSLEIHATSTDEEWRCVVSMDQVCKVCPELINYKPHQATSWHNEYRINVNAVVLAPLFKTLVLKTLPGSRAYQLVSTLQTPPPLLINPPPETINSKAEANKDWNQPLSYRGLKTIHGTCYYLTMRELWDGRVLIEISLYDSYTDNLVVKTFEEQHLLPFIHCIAAMQTVSTPVKLQTGIPAQIRPAIIQLLPHALVLDTTTNSLGLDLLRLQESLPPKYCLPTKAISFEHQGRPLSIEYLPAQSDIIVENVVPRLLSVLHRSQLTRGIRLQDNSLALVQVFGFQQTEKESGSFYSLLKLTRMSTKGIDDPRWLVVQRDVPIAFVIQLWCPLRL